MNYDSGNPTAPQRVQIMLSARASGLDARGGNVSPKLRIVPPTGGWGSLLELATREVFEIMLGTPLEPMADPEATRVTDMTAMIGLAGKLCGVLSICCSSATATRIAARMLGIESEEVTDSVRDALGEMCNMAAGNFKAKINGMADACMLSIPTVVSGRDYQIHSLAAGERFEVAVTLEGLPIWVVLDLHS